MKTQRIIGLLLLSLSVCILVFTLNSNKLSHDDKNDWATVAMAIMVIGMLNVAMGKFNFERDHPERASDEVYIANTDQEDVIDIGWKTKRAGNIAYDIRGKKIGQYPKVFPIFVKISEIKEKENGKEILKRLLPK
jgi:hypothetical protein